MPKAAN